MNGTVEDPLAWRDFADGDLRTARVLSEREDAGDFTRIVAFHAHQAAEKYLKGLLALHECREPPKIHNLRLLLTQSIRYVPEMETPELEDAANGLDQFYVPSRYPGEVGGSIGPITAQEASEALAWAESIASVVRPYLVAGDG